MQDSLVPSAREGSFVPEPRHDILVEEIGTKVHGGRVCGVGDDISLRVWFGTFRKSSRPVQKETIKDFERKSESQKKDFEDTLAAERESPRKYMEYLYVVCENTVISIIYDIYFVLCSCVIYSSMF